MNKKILDELARWMLDCLLEQRKDKAKKIEKIYDKMFERQWRVSSPKWWQL